MKPQENKIESKIKKSPIILDGRSARAELKKTLMQKIERGIAAGKMPPTLAIVQVGDRADSNSFIAAKKKFAAEIGAQEKHINISDTTDMTGTAAAGAAPALQKEVVETVRDLSADPSVHGIIVQLPLPSSIDKDAVFAALSPKKDIDGLTDANVGKWSTMWPATARGIRELLDFYDIPLAGKNVVVVGRSSLVGKPVAAMCLAENAIVTICHSGTPNLSEHTRQADILIVAIGKPGYIGASYVKEGQIVIDVGITRTADGVVGDVDFDAVRGIVAGITPVPGGVGQMTVLALFENLADAWYHSKS